MPQASVTAQSGSQATACGVATASSTARSSTSAPTATTTRPDTVRSARGGDDGPVDGWFIGRFTADPDAVTESPHMIA